MTGILCRRWWLACTALALTGCDGGQQNQPPADPADADARAAQALAELQQLPYAGDVEIEEDETSGVVERDRDRMYPGYTLYSLHKRSRAELIDESGKLHKAWEDPAGRHWDNVELLPNGDLVTTGADPAAVQGILDEARYVMRLSWDGEILWKQPMFSHHDITTTPDGNLMLLTFQRRDADEVHQRVELRDDQITILSPAGELVSQLSLFDTIARTPDRYPYDDVQPGTMGGRQWVDLFHCNALEWMDDPALVDRHPVFGLDNVLFCSRHQSRIAAVDMRQQEIVWSWGRGELDGPHDATALDNGHIMVFDNGLSRGWSRVIELDPVSGEIVWQYAVEADRQKAERHARDECSCPNASICLQRRTDMSDRDFYTKSKGSNQRLPNGNTLICNSDNGELFEVTHDEQRIVWRYLAPAESNPGARRVRPAFVRAYRYERDFIDGLFRAHGQEPPSVPD